MTKESWRAVDEPSFREAKPEPARVMELDLPHRLRMRARIPGFEGFEDRQKFTRYTRGVWQIGSMHLTMAGAYVDSM